MTSLLHRAIRFVAPLAVTFAVSLSALAGEATDLVKAKQTEVINALKNQSQSSARDAKIAATLVGLFDYETMAKNSLSTEEWDKHTDAEKSEFSGLLKQLIQKNIERNLQQSLNYNVEYVGEDGSAPKITVKTKAIKSGSRDEPYTVNYVMQKDSNWKSVDVVTEDVSLVDNYRSQFTKIIAKEGWAGLIKKMKDRLANGG